MADIIRTYQGSQTPGLCLSDVLDFHRVKNKIACKLINANANRELLKSVPHINWLDLSIVFYMMLGQSESGQMTAMICLEQMQLWGTTAEELCHIEYKNMEHLLPLKIMTMTEVMKEMMQKNLGEAFTEELKDGLEDMGGLGRVRREPEQQINLYVQNEAMSDISYRIEALKAQSKAFSMYDANPMAFCTQFITDNTPRAKVRGAFTIMQDGSAHVNELRKI